MAGVLDRSSQQRRSPCGEPAAGCTPRKPILPSTGRRAKRSLFSVVGMGAGYLGLVAILSVAPFWHQVMLPQQSQYLVCTDFGGSR